MVHRLTGEFYFGFRCANKVRSEYDLGIKYFTSSKHIKNNFLEYDAIIVAEFFTKDDAYVFEQQLIKEHFNHPLILNKHWQNTKKYSMLGFKRPDVGEMNRKFKSKPKEIRIFLCCSCNKEITKEEFCHHPPKEHYYCNATCRNRVIHKNRTSKKGTSNTKNKGKPAWNKGLSSARRGLPNIKNKGKPAWNKGLSNEHAADNGRRGAAKQSNTVTGRRRKYRDDGSWYWVYPEGNG